MTSRMGELKLILQNGLSKIPSSTGMQQWNIVRCRGVRSKALSVGVSTGKHFRKEVEQCHVQREALKQGEEETEY